MEKRFRIAIILLIISWATLFYIMAVVVGFGFLRQNDFFRIGVPVMIHGIEITKKSHYAVLWLVVFANGFTSTLNYYFVTPVIQRTVLGVKDAPEQIPNKLSFLAVTFVWDAWWLTRTMIALFGYTTQLGFLLAHAIGMLLGSQISVSLYLYKTSWFKGTLKET